MLLFDYYYAVTTNNRALTLLHISSTNHLASVTWLCHPLFYTCSFLPPGYLGFQVSWLKRLLYTSALDL